MGEILKIIHKKDRKDLFSGARIMVMNTSDLEKKRFQVMYISKGMSSLLPTKVKCLRADIVANQIINNLTALEQRKITPNRQS